MDIHDNSDINQYAQKMFSTPGKHDGQYWKNSDGSSGGPIGGAVAKARWRKGTALASPDFTGTISRS